MSDLKQRIFDDVKQAMRTQDKPLLATLRLITAAIKQYEVDNRVQASEQDVVSILDKMRKQRTESIAQYQQANRTDLVTKEQFELDVIASYLPQPLSEAELDKLIQMAMTEANAQSISDMGKVMAILKPQCQGRADLAKVGQQIKQLLQGT